MSLVQSLPLLSLQGLTRSWSSSSSPSLKQHPFLCPPLNRRSHHHHHRRLSSSPSDSKTLFNYSIRCCSSAMPLQEFSTSTSQDSLLYSRAFWVSKFTVAWNVDIGEAGSCILYASRSASLSVSNVGISGHDVEVKLEKSDEGLPDDVVAKFPHIRDYRAFKLPETLDAKSLVKCQLVVASYDVDGKISNATSLQLPGILDELFSYDGPLGAHYSKDVVSLYLWAPTAQAVQVFIYKDSFSKDPLEIGLLKEVNGVWSIEGPKDWECCYYVYEVSVYHPSTSNVKKCYANDPYARGLSSDGKRTLLVNLSSDSLKPEGWDNLAKEKPSLLSFSDISIYELHIRDFSANDHTMHPDFRGGYLAFTLEVGCEALHFIYIQLKLQVLLDGGRDCGRILQDSAGVLHLKKLSNAGLTHVHLLPTFQFGGVDDIEENWMCVDNKILENLPPDSEEQQAQITAVCDNDGYNWGYNPVLWGVPKGSYASNPNGPSRTIEFRKMVQALNGIGLRVVLDVVYNHLHRNGPFDPNSVLDKIVPGYYLRRNNDGLIENSTCENNTASEHYMVERLIIDDLVNWVVNYKVDGFRFDLMGHIMKSTMVHEFH